MAPKSLSEMEEGESLLKRSQSHYGEISSTYSTIPSETRSSDRLKNSSVEQSESPNTQPRFAWPFPKLENVNADAVQFGVRMACCIAASALFSLIRANTTQYPQAMWVLITVLFVSWFPSLDAASVVEKCLQRIYGTLLGATVGLLCGFATIPLKSRSLRAWIIGSCMWVYTFCICFAALQFKVKGTNAKIISRYNYAVRCHDGVGNFQNNTPTVLFGKEPHNLIPICFTKVHLVPIDVLYFYSTVFF